MHLSFVTSSLRLSGGVQVVVEYANRLTERGHQVSIVTPRDAVDPEIDVRISPAVHVHQSELTLKPRAGIVYQMRLALSLARSIPQNDVVIATHTPTLVPTILSSLGRSRRRLWLYMDYPEMFEGRPVEQLLLRRGAARFEHVMTLSEASRSDALSTGAKQASVVGLGLSDAELFTPIQFAKSRSDLTLMYLGDERPRKGLSEFLSATETLRREIPDLRLLIVVKESLSIDLPVGSEIVLRPRREELPDLYRRSDVFVFSSWGEGFGLPPLEAMACGVPVVLTDSRGVREYARSGENCLMVPPRDVGQLAEALRRVLSDEHLARSLSETAVETAQRFQWDVCVDRFEAVLCTSV